LISSTIANTSLKKLDAPLKTRDFLLTYGEAKEIAELEKPKAEKPKGKTWQELKFLAQIAVNSMKPEKKRKRR
jgi:hypothetical protein